MIGVLVNTLAIIIGTIAGLFIRKGVPERFSDTVMKGIGLCVMCIGWTGTLEGDNTLILIISVLVGAFIGEGIDIDRRFNSFAKKIEEKFSKNGKQVSVAEGFVTASLVFCVGAMAVVGSIQAGLEGNNETLYAKSILDCIVAMIFASSMGIGVIFSAVSVFIYQGIIALCAVFATSVLNQEVIAEMTAVGSLLIFALGMNLSGITKFKMMNYIPSVFIPIVLCYFM